MITIVIPVYNEELFLSDVLRSISTYPSITQVLVVDGGSTDNTFGVFQEFKNNCSHLDLSFIQNPDKLQGYALNLCLNYVSNQFLIRLDAHSHVPPYQSGGIDYFHDIKALYSSGSYCSIGFKQRFAYKNILQCTLHILSFTPFLSRSKYRYALRPTTTRDTVWLFATSVSEIRAIDGFRPELTPNEDYDFNKRLIGATNLPLLVYPQLPLYYFPRSSISSLFRQYFRYGYSRGLSFSSRSSTFSLLLVSVIQLFVISLTIIFATHFTIPFRELYLLLVIIFFLIACLAPFVDRLTYIPSFSLVRRYCYFIISSFVAPLVLFLPILAFVCGRLSSLLSFIVPSFRCMVK